MLNKEEIIKQIIAQEEKFIEKLEATYEQFKNASDLDEEATMDRQEMSHANEAKDMQMRMKVQLDKANQDLEELKNTGSTSHTTVQPGAIVVTQKNLFFAGVSIHTLDISGKELLGVSSESPAYKTILGLTKGDQFKLGDHEYTIEEIM